MVWLDWWPARKQK